MTKSREADERYRDFLLDDAAARLQHQHDYTLAGLKTLLLLNGGAIIGLLTYAGNLSGQGVVSGFRCAFLWYLVGLCATALTYLSAYVGRASFMNDSAMRALPLMERKSTDRRTPEQYQDRGNRCIKAGIFLVLVALSGFGVGSYQAANAIAKIAVQEAPNVNTNVLTPR